MWLLLLASLDDYRYGLQLTTAQDLTEPDSAARCHPLTPLSPCILVATFDLYLLAYIVQIHSPLCSPQRITEALSKEWRHRAISLDERSYINTKPAPAFRAATSSCSLNCLPSFSSHAPHPPFSAPRSFPLTGPQAQLHVTPQAPVARPTHLPRSSRLRTGSRSRLRPKSAKRFCPSPLPLLLSWACARPQRHPKTDICAVRLDRVVCTI